MALLPMPASPLRRMELEPLPWRNRWILDSSSSISCSRPKKYSAGFWPLGLGAPQRRSWAASAMISSVRSSGPTSNSLARALRSF